MPTPASDLDRFTGRIAAFTATLETFGLSFRPLQPWMVAAVAAEYCTVCRRYWVRRGAVVATAAVTAADRAGVHPHVLLERYRGSVHARHLAGGCLSTRRKREPRKNPNGSTTVFVSRCCNGCGTDLGDVRPVELDAAVAGVELPDVRLECGCYTSSEVPA